MIVQVKPNTTKIYLGRQGENLARRIQFGLSSWMAEYGAGTPALIHKRPGDTVAYPVTLRGEGAAAYWDVTNADTEIPGNGKCELSYYVDGVIAKSVIYQTVVEPSMNEEIGYEPQALPGWVDRVNMAVADAGAATQRALEAADTAEKAAEAANRAAENAGEISSVATDEEVTEMLDELFGDGPSPDTL